MRSRESAFSAVILNLEKFATRGSARTRTDRRSEVADHLSVMLNTFATKARRNGLTRRSQKGVCNVTISHITKWSSDIAEPALFR
jgi:hypothetical protein